jgi:ferric-dicitrate binding protein FerR (iron transport regulator)
MRWSRGVYDLRSSILVVIAASAFAATPVASVTSSSDFQLSGANVIAAGVPSWPVMAGDTVVAGTSAARIRFVDGTMVTLGPRSQVTLQRRTDDLSLRLVNGFISFTLASGSALSVYSGNTPVHAQPGVLTTASTGTGVGAATNLIGLPPGGPPSLSQH